MIEPINKIAEIWMNWMGSMFWQVSVLVVFIGAVDLLLHKRVWPQVRYALWLLVLVKLVLPPTFSLSTSIVSHVRKQADRTIAQLEQAETVPVLTSEPVLPTMPLVMDMGIKPVAAPTDKPRNEIIKPATQLDASPVMTVES
ncbi:MAG: hypothetical protein JXM79_19600, partial [Sedimentisphaerales bacterium]|nr:hypothetical protein [Sedimentisphaerales bacterium]